jgi:hypothetical protein
MTLEAVYLHGGIAMAGGAKMFLAVNVRAGLHVTVDALDQAVLLGADAFTHGFVALVLDALHVPAPHDFHGFHAFGIGIVFLLGFG